MDLKHKIALVRIAQANTLAEPRRQAIEQYLSEHTEIPRGEAQDLLPFTVIVPDGENV